MTGIVVAGAAFGSVQTDSASAMLAAVSASGPDGAFVVDGRPTFPIALSNPPPLDSRTPTGADGLDSVVHAGVTIFRVGPLSDPWTSSTISFAEAWDEAAFRRGVHTWVSLGNVSTATPGSHADFVLQKVVDALTSDSSGAGLGLWKGADEPNWGGAPPAALRFAYCRVTSRGDASWCAGETPLDPRHLWVTIEAPRGTAEQMSGYSRVTDTQGVDVYPVAWAVAHPDLHQVGIWTRMVAAITPGRSVWTTLQICSSGSSDPSGDFVQPTRLQERYMIYDAIINGARALSFFGGDNPACWNLSDKTTGWNWTFWNTSLRPLVQEINAGSPIAPALSNPASTRTLGTSSSAVEAISRRAVTGSRAQLWVLAANNDDRARTVTLSGLPSSAAWAGVYTEHRPIRILRGKLTDRFGPWQVHVYELVIQSAHGR